jgi:hypothetical protein
MALNVLNISSSIIKLTFSNNLDYEKAFGAPVFMAPGALAPLALPLARPR